MSEKKNDEKLRGLWILFVSTYGLIFFLTAPVINRNAPFFFSDSCVDDRRLMSATPCPLLLDFRHLLLLCAYF